MPKQLGILVCRLFCPKTFDYSSPKKWTVFWPSWIIGFHHLHHSVSFWRNVTNSTKTKPCFFGSWEWSLFPVHVFPLEPIIETNHFWKLITMILWCSFPFHPVYLLNHTGNIHSYVLGTLGNRIGGVLKLLSQEIAKRNKIWRILLKIIGITGKKWKTNNSCNLTSINQFFC